MNFKGENSNSRLKSILELEKHYMKCRGNFFKKRSKNDERGTIRENFLKKILFYICKSMADSYIFWNWKILLLENIQIMKDYIQIMKGPNPKIGSCSHT